MYLFESNLPRAGSPSHNFSLTSGAHSNVGRARIGPGQTMAAKALAR